MQFNYYKNTILSRKKAVVTGANGFVGAALCKELSECGYEVIAVIKDKMADMADIHNLNNVKIVYSDLSEFWNLADKIPDRHIDVFFHLAWIGSAGPLRGNYEVQIKNIQYTCETVKSCVELKCKKFVFASSIMEYEIVAFMMTAIKPEINTLYSSAKIAADYMARAIAAEVGIDYIRAIISNVYGPGEQSHRLINSSLRKLLSGQHCAFSPGEQIYDFIYISDAAKALRAIGEKGFSDKTYYIGSQEPKPLKNFLSEMRNQVDPEIKIGLGEIPYNGISLTYKEFDIDAIKNDTGFIPEVSFDEGIRKTISWIKEVG